MDKGIKTTMTMKLSYAILLQEAGFNSITKGKWIKNLRILSDFGYKGVELNIRNPEKVNIANIEKILSQYKLELSAIGTGQIFVNDGLSLSSLNQDLRNKAISLIKKHIDIAKIFNSQVIIGLVRGRKNNLSDSDKRYYKNLIHSFKKICDYANKNKIIIIVEPINRYETDFLNRTDETLNFIKTFKCKFLKILLDTFHMNIEEQNFIDPIIKARNYLNYIHLADNNRMCPGKGHIDFQKIIEVLKKIDYAGYLSAEVLPLPNFKTSARDYINNINRLL